MAVQFRPGASLVALMTVEKEKEQIRADIRGQLEKQSAEARRNKSNTIAAKLRKDANLQNARVVLVYLSLAEEVDTKLIVEYALAQEKEVAVPWVDVKSRMIVPSRVMDWQEDLAAGSYGILEPKPGKVRPVEFEKLDLVLVPGIAFDQTNHRLGRGGGYYDRLLAKLPRRTVTYGLAFDLQLVKTLPVTELDIPVGRVIHN